MDKINIIKESAPHLRRRDSLNLMMLDVVISLLPVIVFSIVIYHWYAVRNILISVATMELCEFIFVLIKNRIPYDGTKHTLKEHWAKQKAAYRLSNFMVPLVSALIFALIMPADSNPKAMIYIALVLGSVFGLVVGKLLFGGTGKNIFNPAAVGMVFAKLCFGSFYQYPAVEGIYDVSTGGTALSSNLISLGSNTFNLTEYSVLDMLFGKMPGVIGETCKVAILVGLFYLLVRHTIDWRIPLSYLGIFCVDMFVVGLIVSAAHPEINPFHFLAYQALSGGLFFGATYMATDPVTSPITRPGRFMYGVLLGSLTVIIRLFAALPEGVVFSILIGNMLTCVFDYYKWETNEYHWKNLLAIGLLFLIPLLIVVWAVCVEVF